MRKVNFDEAEITKIGEKGYIFDDKNQKNIITIRNSSGEPLVEIIYRKETDEIVVLEEMLYYWCTEICNICWDAKKERINIIAIVKYSSRTSAKIIIPVV